jgi:hypothetical protein
MTKCGDLCVFLEKIAEDLEIEIENGFNKMFEEIKLLNEYIDETVNNDEDCVT